MNTPILTTKLYIPPPPANLVPRPRLTKKLNQGLHQKFTLISAPAGFGKTTLLSECAGICRFPVAWLSLDESDNDLPRFLNYFIASLQTIYPKLGENAEKNLQSPHPRVEAILTSIINEISSDAKGELVLVLDDYHVIESHEIDQAIAFFLENMPHNLHLVIAGRTDPTLPLPLLRSRGQMTEIRIDDLRFTPEEAAAFLNNSIGLEISSQDIAALDARTEGWIAGLQMAALSMQGLNGSDEITQFVQKFSSSHRYILDYLTDEVLQHRPEGTRDFLLQTSILKRLSAPLCQAVTLMNNSQAILEILDAANLFLIPLDNERCWYRYHHLFNDLLLKRLQLLQPDLLPELHKRASKWYALNGLISDAIEHSLAAKDYDVATQLTEQTFLDRMGHGEDFSMMLGRLVALPDEIIHARPFLGIMYAWMLSITLQLDDVEPRLMDIETRFSEQLPTELTRQIAVIRAEVYRHRGEYRKSIECCLQALESLPTEFSYFDQQTYTGITNDLAWGYLVVGEMEDARRWFKESLVIGQHSTSLRLIGLSGSAFVEELSGDLQQAVETCLQGLHLIELTSQNTGSDVPAAVYIHFRLANLLRERNELEEAEFHFKRGIDLGLKWNAVGDTMRDGYLDYSKLKLALGDFQGAFDVLQEADKLVPQYRSVPGFGDTIEAHKARIKLAWAATTGNPNHLHDVTRWAAGRNLQVGRSVGSINEEFEYLLWVRYLLAQAQARKALLVLDGLIAQAREDKRIGRVIEMLILQALAHQANRNTRKALASIESALILAEPQGYVRVFVDEGSAVEALLNLIATQGFASSYVMQLLAALKPLESIEQLNTNPTDFPTQMVESLTKRELEVLYLLAEGATNQEIAENLVISGATAKKHVSNIIGKLQVTNRTQAVIRAKELNLI